VRLARGHSGVPPECFVENFARKSPQPLRGFGLPFDTNGFPFDANGFPFAAYGLPFDPKVFPFAAYGLSLDPNGLLRGVNGFPVRAAYGVEPAPGRNGLVVRGRSSRSSR
jgi:hypothetical protein